MPNLLEVYQAAVVMKDEIAAGRPVGAWKASLVVQQYAIELLQGAGVRGEASDLKAQTKAVLEECVAELTRVEAAPAVAAWGDGKILKFLLEVAKVVLPLLI